MELHTRDIQFTGINGKSTLPHLLPLLLPNSLSQVPIPIPSLSDSGVDYPHYFGAGEFGGNMPLCAGEPRPYEEFPLLRGSLFSNYVPVGPDRIVIKDIGWGYYLYCGAVTHTGAGGGNAFVLCT